MSPRKFIVGYRIISQKFCRYLCENGHNPELFDPQFGRLTPLQATHYVYRQLGRIILLILLQQSGAFVYHASKQSCTTESGSGDRNLVQHLYSISHKAGSNFLTDVLQPLILQGFVDAPNSVESHDVVLNGLGRITVPRLGINIFERDKLDGLKATFLPDQFKSLFRFLRQYTWTLDETSADDEAKILGPGVLADIFEAQLLTNRTSGTYYTPTSVVRTMCEQSLIACLTQKCGERHAAAIRQLVESHDARLLADQPRLKARVQQILTKLTVLDPAVGCGAFPMGMLHSLVACRHVLEPECTPGELTREICANNLFGADIETSALRITQLRCYFAALATTNAVELTNPTPSGHFVCTNALTRKHFARKHFDIVIANPPYGVKMQENEKTAYKQRFSRLEKRFDIYMAFFELALSLARETVCFITPDKWLSKSYALKFREACMLPYMSQVLHLGNDVFGTALVDSIVTLFNLRGTRALQFFQTTESNGVEPVMQIDKSTLTTPYLIDQYFHTPDPILAHCETQPCRLEQFAKCEYAMVSPTLAYQLKSVIQSNPDPAPDQFKLLTTGCIGKYVDRWGQVTMKYLKDRYDSPVISLDACQQVCGEAMADRIQSPKLIIKGLNLLDACLDLSGRIMSTVATLNIRTQSIDLLKVLAAIVNASITHDYIHAKYSSSSFCGGLEFTPAMFNGLPVPDLTDLTTWKDVIDPVTQLLALSPNSDAAKQLCQTIDTAVKRHYGIES